MHTKHAKLATGGLEWFSQQRGWISSVNVHTALCIVRDCVLDCQTVAFCIELLSTYAFVHKWRSMQRTEKNVGHVS